MALTLRLTGLESPVYNDLKDYTVFSGRWGRRIECHVGTNRVRAGPPPAGRRGLAYRQPFGRLRTQLPFMLDRVGRRQRQFPAFAGAQATSIYPCLGKMSGVRGKTNSLLARPPVPIEDGPPSRDSLFQSRPVRPIGATMAKHSKERTQAEAQFKRTQKA